MRRVLRWVLRPFLRLILWLHRPGDDWEEYPVSPPFWRFGAGSTMRFSWYFEGVSSVAVSSSEEVVTWLLGCRYVPDVDLFQQADFWQHPRTFERLRQGDCEDFALWGWRKLNEAGLPARLFIGKVVRNGVGSTRHHAWVVFAEKGEEYVLDASAGEETQAVRRLQEVREAYRPHFSVDAYYRTRTYGGYATTMKEDAERLRRFGSRDQVGR